MKFKRIYRHLLFAAMALGLTACLKDDERFTTADIATHRIIELPATSQFRAVALPFEDRDTIISPITVNLAASEVASEDITVNLTTVNSKKVIDNYNNVNHSHVEILPSSLYTLQGTGLTVTIPKGSNTGKVNLQINAVDLDPSITYGLAFNITGVDKEGYVISGNLDTVLVTFGAKNDYDGAYSLEIRIDASDRPTVQTGVWGEWGGEVHLVTTSGSSVNLFDDWGFGQFIQPIITSTGGYSGFGQTNPRFTIDPATNKIISITNDAPVGTLNRRFEIDPEGPNYYDPAEKKIYASFIMTQTGFAPAKIKDVFTFVGPRP
ncbi:DUF1735 domain-containing protein [Paradesertivirga mongoliensis]|uniref:DUF1735 domain-containing protein n=1 Tax=Paradesertivirga mongoliensis TaxID=2100740 RepID=A0ABW4ZIH2_9SPHI|nr:DUF1735 domain-containing protein [Pedobacter mongoliensis]